MNKYKEVICDTYSDHIIFKNTITELMICTHVAFTRVFKVKSEFILRKKIISFVSFF